VAVDERRVAADGRVSGRMGNRLETFGQKKWAGRKSAHSEGEQMAERHKLEKAIKKYSECLCYG
jgi:hypothetical protein